MADCKRYRITATCAECGAEKPGPWGYVLTMSGVEAEAARLRMTGAVSSEVRAIAKAIAAAQQLGSYPAPPPGAVFLPQKPAPEPYSALVEAARRVVAARHGALRGEWHAAIEALYAAVRELEGRQ